MIQVNRQLGFTLAELLIALAILGVIATMTIPKVITAQQNQTFNARAKEDAAMISEAFQKAKIEGIVTSNMVPQDLFIYMNYIRQDTTSTIDGEYTLGNTSCDPTNPCLKLHNGSMLKAWNSSFGGSNSTNLIWFVIDPDGIETDGTTNGPGKAISFALYYNGAITTWKDMKSGSVSSDGVQPTCPLCDPPWFSW